MAQGYFYKRQPQPVLRQRRPRSRKWLLFLLLALGTFVYFSRESKAPEAILVLGGSPDRERFAAQFAQTHPKLPIWISGGSNPEYAEMVFAEAGINWERVHLDYQAVDTVTNFTTVLAVLDAQGIDSLYLLTSDYHMPRARLIGRIVLGSRGIQFQPVAIPSQEAPESPESWEKTLRDGARAVLWIFTGSTGSRLGKTFPAQPIHFLIKHLSQP